MTPAAHPLPNKWAKQWPTGVQHMPKHQSQAPPATLNAKAGVDLGVDLAQDHAPTPETNLNKQNPQPLATQAEVGAVAGEVPARPIKLAAAATTTNN